MTTANTLFRLTHRPKWFLAALGNTKGSIQAGQSIFSLKPGEEAIRIKHFHRSLCFQSSSGSFGDSLDDFIFCYTEILPEEENFEISAFFTVKEVSAALSWQSGYGIFVADTVNCADKNCRFRNHLGIGRFRTRSTVSQSAGMRVVSGYRDSGASEVAGKRVVDLSRAADFPAQSPRISAGESYLLSLKKTDAGFTGSITFQNETQTFSFPGCDILTQQTPQKIYVGLAVAGALTLDVSDIHFLPCPGKASRTPKDAIQMALPDYPFPRELLAEVKPTCETISTPEIYVSPAGEATGDGSRLYPLDLQTALSAANEGQTIWLLDGVYRPSSPYYVPKNSWEDSKQRTAVRAEHAGKAVLDGSNLLQAAPLFILRGDRWHLKDLVFCNSPLSGLLICGSDNRIEHCEAYGNRDTGILICTYPGTDRSEWPCGNHVICCDSHHNRDDAGENADGFGAKLSIGEGNVFFECTAHHNVDDGFDLFSKNVLGPIGSVTIENCVAYEKGPSKEDIQKGKSGGMGFKLGGDHLAIPHRVKNCIAFQNHEAGFCTNNNPSTRMENLTAWKNGRLPLLYNYRLLTRRTDIPTDWQLSGLLPENSVYSNVAGQVDMPLVIREAVGQSNAEIDQRQIQELECQFVSTDTSIPITRDEQDLIEMHGLFSLKEDSLILQGAAGPLPLIPGAKLDAEHLEERLQRKRQLCM